MGHQQVHHSIERDERLKIEGRKSIRAREERETIDYGGFARVDLDLPSGLVACSRAATVD